MAAWGPEVALLKWDVCSTPRSAHSTSAERGAPVDERVKALVTETKVTALVLVICLLNPFCVSAPLFSRWP